MAVFLLFQAVYFAFLPIFSLLATSMVVYTVASVYAGREVSPSRGGLLLRVPIDHRHGGCQYDILHSVWGVLCQLASVAAVLEEASHKGHAINKSHTLIKGKLWVVSLIFLKFNLLLGLTQLGFQNLVVHGNNTVSTGIMSRVAFGVWCCSLLCALILFALVVQTVVYFVCKSYHHENIPKSALSDHLEGYLGEYVPLVS
ncbi:uncharacterized protein J3R85_014288 [Psidium guajava]|nr:uncharacterized protein J3R85_014288 [Psidium guajava]